MITIQQTAGISLNYPLERLGPAEKLLFFDIETTGFSPVSSNLYLIGCIYPAGDGSWKMIQWFADSPEAEAECLEAFFSLAKERPILVHFNGDTFDLPYLLGRAQRLKIGAGLPQIESIDIFRKIRPCKKLLGMDSLKLKSIEQFLGIQREDRYTGGQLIQVYSDYLSTKSPARLQLLTLHNADDLRGMAAILPILNYPDMLESAAGLTKEPAGQNPEKDAFYLSKWQLLTDNASQDASPALQLDFAGSWHLPVPLERHGDFGWVSFCGSSICCRIPLYQGSLKYFFPDYQNYYYLPAEDMAVHKSVGTYVDKSSRKKATARTCYIKKEGLFLPQPGPVWEPEFRLDFDSPQRFAAWSPELLSDSQKACSYLKLLLDKL